MDSFNLAITIVRTCLQLSGDTVSLQRDTELMGAFPEFNSLTITSIVASIEDQLDCIVEDEELTAEIFATLGSLADFIDLKM